MTAAVGADENDHVSYAGALFDALVADPGLQRLSQRRAPEFPEASEAEIDSLVAKSTEIADSYGVGLTLATDLMMIALGAAMSWNATAERIRNSAPPSAVPPVDPVPSLSTLLRTVRRDLITGEWDGLTAGPDDRSSS